MEWPYTTGLMWAVALVLFASVFGEAFIPIVAIAVIGIHLGIALVPRKEVSCQKTPTPPDHDALSVTSGLSKDKTTLARSLVSEKSM